MKLIVHLGHIIFAGAIGAGSVMAAPFAAGDAQAG